MNLPRRIVDRLVRRPLVWRMFETSVLRLALVALEQRRHYVHRTHWVDRVAAARAIAPNGSVIHGPFHGLRYPSFESAGSMLFPKLLGSYERELHPLIARLGGAGYRAVVDIGCAEGYYAVGFARLWPQTIIYAFDLDPKARRLCRGMASLNGVADRVLISDRCDADTLRTIQLPDPSLILVDCEGAETQILEETVLPRLAHHDLLIEAHDYYDPDISVTLKSRFRTTHIIESIFSMDDTQKVHHYHYPEIACWSLAERRELLAERPAIIEWLYCASRSREA